METLPFETCPAAPDAVDKLPSPHIRTLSLPAEADAAEMPADSGERLLQAVAGMEALKAQLYEGAEVVPVSFEEAEPDAEAVPDEVPPLTDEEAKKIIRRLARYDDEKRALKANYDALVKELDGKRDWLLGLEGKRLQVWVASQLKKGKRSTRILEGVAGFTAQGPKLKVEDPEALLTWAREHQPDAVVEVVDVARLGKPDAYLVPDPETGEKCYQPPSGVKIEPGTDRFYVKSGGKATEESTE